MNSPQTLMNRPRWQMAGFPFALALLAFCMPVIDYGLQIPIILLIVAWAFHPKRRMGPNVWPFVVFAGVFAFYVIGLFYSGRFSNGINDLIQKLTIVLFPLLFVTVAPPDARVVRLVLRFFVMGTVVALMMAFTTSGVEFVQTGDINSFYMSRFSPVHHPSYLAMFVNFSIAVLLLEIERERKFQRSELRLWAVVLVLALALIFPAAKMGFLNFGFLVVFFLIKRIAEKRFRHARTGLLVGVGVLFVVFLRLDPLASGRLGTVVEVLEQTEEGQQQPEIESTTARLHIWKTAIEEVQNHPFGVGVGNTKEAFKTWFRERGLESLAEHGLNAHNQFLQIAVAVGIPAALWFLFSLVYPFKRIWKRRGWIYAFFLFSIAMNFAVESMLEKQSGIVFFTFFNALLFFFGLPHETTQEEPIDPAT